MGAPRCGQPRVARAATGWVLAGVLAAATASDFELHLLDPHTYPDARCLDGSPGGFYLRPGVGDGRSKFKIHICGGGWCYSEQSCGYRAKTNLGSSTFWPPVANTNQSGFPGQWNLGMYGLLGNDTSNSFRDWTAVFIMYCDGSSLTSYRREPLGGLYYRGRPILDGVLNELIHTHGMAVATDVILSGTSAGGMATYAHAELVKSLLPKSTRMVAVPDAGFWLDAVDLKGQRMMRDNTQMGVQLWNTSTHGPGNEECMTAHAATNQTWKCYLAQYVMPYITPPVMVINSLYDPAQYGAVLGLPSRNLSAADATALKEAEAYRKLFQGSILAALTPKDGAFLTACNQHEESCRQPDWEGITVGGISMMAAITQWYDGGAGPHTHVDCGPWAAHPLSCNPTCVALPMHGAC